MMMVAMRQKKISILMIYNTNLNGYKLLYHFKYTLSDKVWGQKIGT